MPTENLYTPDCIRTFTGKYVNVFNVDPDQICIEDIAHALSMQCRFGGHLPVYYSVAQHSILVCESLSRPQKLAGLLHDASEAYLLDIPRPIKGGLANYKEIEHNLMKAIAGKFGFQYPLHDTVKEVDNFYLEWEWHNLMLNRHPDSKNRFCKNHSEAKYWFLTLYDQVK